MKKIPTLLIALSLVSLPAFAQMHPMPHSMPHPAPGAESSGASSTSGAASGTSDSASGTSGASSTSNSASGASNGMPSAASTSATPDLSPIARLKAVTQDDVTYLCGGVGEEEVNYMKQEAKGYDLMLTFATRSGAYLADVDVDIKDAGGNSVLQIACDSPILLVDLPKGGTYKVRAETAGYELNKTVRVAGGRNQQRVASSILSWPQRVAEAGGPPTSTGSGSSGDRAAGSGAR